MGVIIQLPSVWEGGGNGYQSEDSKRELCQIPLTSFVYITDYQKKTASCFLLLVVYKFDSLVVYKFDAMGSYSEPCSKMILHPAANTFPLVLGNWLGLNS